MMTHAIGILKQKAKTLGKDGFLEIRKKQFQFGVGIFSSTTLVPVVVAIGEEMLMDNLGVEHEYSKLSAQDLFTLTDYVKTL